jgi:hypothetical protein
MRLGLVIPGKRYAAFGPPAPHGTFHGSSYKLGEALRQLCDLEVLCIDHPLLEDDLARCDAMVVKGDASETYRLALELGMPYLLICHDVASFREPHQRRGNGERDMIEKATGVIFTTDPLRAFCAQRYVLPPHEVVALRPLRRDLDFEPLPKLPGRTLVYAGGILEAHLAATNWGYRCYQPIFESALRCGWRVCVYPALPRPRAEKELRALGCQVLDPVPEPDLPRQLSRYTAGLLGYNVHGVPDDAVDYARKAWPNKTWLYLSAGIPTIAVNPEFECARLAREWSVPLADLNRFRTLGPGDLPTITRAVREAQTIEQDLPKLRRLLDLL